MKGEIELKIHGMSTALQPAEAYALVLEEVHGKRKLAMIIGALEAQAIKVAMVGYKAPRPLTHVLYLSTLERLNTSLEKVSFYKVKDGIYYAYLHLRTPDETFTLDARASDAIALALHAGCPIMTTEPVIAKSYLREEMEGGFSVNINVVSLDMLKNSLNQAIEEENYELASRLRDEIKRREQDASAPDDTNTTQTE